MLKDKNKYKTNYSLDLESKTFTNDWDKHIRLFILFKCYFYIDKNTWKVYHRLREKFSNYELKHFSNTLILLLWLEDKLDIRKIVEDWISINFDFESIEFQDFIKRVDFFVNSVKVNLILKNHRKIDDLKLAKEIIDSLLIFTRFVNFYKLYILNLSNNKRHKYWYNDEIERLNELIRNNLDKKPVVDRLIRRLKEEEMKKDEFMLNRKWEIVKNLLKHIDHYDKINLKIQEWSDWNTYLYVWLKFLNKDFVWTHIILNEMNESLLEIQKNILKLFNESKNVWVYRNIFLWIISYHCKWLDKE